MKVDPTNVRQGAGKIDGAHSDVSKLIPPSYTNAGAGLQGFATAATLFTTYDAVKSSLDVVGGRYDVIGQLLRRAADMYEHLDNKSAMSLTQLAANGLTSVGDLNSAT